MEIKQIIYLAPIIIIPWIIVGFIAVSSGRNVRKNFRKLEDKYGLQIDFSKNIGIQVLPSASGVYRNRKIKIESHITDTIDGKKISPHTTLTIECNNPADFSFLIARRNRRNNAAFISGSSLIDDNEFDDKFILQTNDIDKLRKIFDFNTKFKLDQIYSLGFDGIIKLEGNCIRYSEKGLMKDDHSLLRLELMMHELCDIADSMKYS